MNVSLPSPTRGSSYRLATMHYMPSPARAKSTGTSATGRKSAQAFWTGVVHYLSTPISVDDILSVSRRFTRRLHFVNQHWSGSASATGSGSLPSYSFVSCDGLFETMIYDPHSQSWRLSIWKRPPPPTPSSPSTSRTPAPRKASHSLRRTAPQRSTKAANAKGTPKRAVLKATPRSSVWDSPLTLRGLSLSQSRQAIGEALSALLRRGVGSKSSAKRP